MKRFESLDWLRGLMAFAIMIYHLVGWKIGQQEAGSVLGNFGVYGVSIFFVLSGLSMGIVYHNYIKNFQTSIAFFVRRLFRLLPLLWIAIAIVSAIVYLVNGEIDIYKIFLNITLLFGFVSPAEYMNVGAWSIGNEAFYYAFTPLLIMFYSRSKFAGNFIVLLLTAIGIYFAFSAIDSTSTLSNQWKIYIHPFNNFFLYACGLALFYNFHNLVMPNIAILLIVISLSILCWYPVEGDQINIVTGINRVIFAFSSIALTLGFYKLELSIPEWLSKPFANLGEATYGVYLLHPIVFMFANKLIYNPYICIVVTVFATVLVANLTYHFYEKPFIKIGKKVTTVERVNLRQAM
ncbi:TPA: acyltransferase family protein [Acinetobacter baumannii]